MGYYGTTYVDKLTLIEQFNKPKDNKDTQSLWNNKKASYNKCNQQNTVTMPLGKKHKPHSDFITDHFVRPKSANAD